MARTFAILTAFSGSLLWSINTLQAADLASVTLRFKPSEKAAFEPAITAAVKKTLEFYKTSYGIVLKRPVDLIVSQDPKFIAKALHKAHRGKLSLKPMQKRAAKRCKNARRIAGTADNKAIRICFNSPVQVNEIWLDLNKDKLNSVITHEFMHIIQRQLSGSNYFKIGKRPKHGPKWMNEGTAMYAENQFMAQNGKPKRRLTDIFKWANKTTKSLSKFSTKGGDLLPTKQYGLAELAGYLLIERFGQEKMLLYWKNLKNGRSWEHAFKKTYGITMKRFMKDVEKLRGDEDAVRKWIAQS